MAKCDYPQKVLDKGTRSKSGKVYNEDVMARCGKCYNCIMTRMRGWIFRLKQEYKVSQTAHFVTLTYDHQNVPLTENKYMTLYKKDVQDFLKRLRKTQLNKIKYMACGEYGGKGQRPHYHLIMFNLIPKEKDIYNQIKITWQKGDVHIGTVTEASTAYTLEYISKQSDIKKHERDDRKQEFSLFSKGLGSNYLTENIKKYHQDNYQNMFIQIEDNKKIALPKYYRDKIFKDQDDLKKKQVDHVQKEIIKQEIEHDKKYTFQEQEGQRRARLNKLNSKKSKNKV